MKLLNASYYKNVPILTYHKVSDDKEVGLTTVTPTQFEEQMTFLFNEGYQTITTFDYNKLPSKPIMISFDDGYESIYKYALPILNKLSFKAVVFIISDYIGKLNTWDANLGGKTFNHLNENQIQKLINYGWEVGSHTNSHRTLMLNSSNEIESSKEKLTALFGSTIKSFSYPFGSSPNSSVKQVSEHYDFGFKATPLNSTQFKIGRCSVYSFDGIKQIKHKINLNQFELLKLKLINQGAKATEIGQIIKLI